MAKIDYLINAPKEGEPPFPPYIYLWLSEHSEIERDGKSYITLSPQLMGDSEIDYYVDRLIEQLNRVRKKAKERLIEG